MSKVTVKQKQEVPLTIESPRTVPLASESQRTVPLARQFAGLLLLLLKMKSWRVTLLCLPALLSLCSLYLPALMTSKKRTDATMDNHLVFYDTKELNEYGHVVLTDFIPAASSTVERILTDRGVNAALLRRCESESKCRAKFVSETDPSVIAYIKYSKTAASIHCLWVQSASLRCAYIYQLMAQSVSRDTSTDGVFKDVRFFTITIPVYIRKAIVAGRLKANKEKKVGNELAVKQKKSLGSSTCASNVDIMGYQGFKQHFEMYIVGSLSLSAAGAAFYFIISTIFCIRALKTDGFYQQLVRDGMSPMLFLATIWIITAVECAALSGMYLLTHVVHCPEFYPIEAMMSLFLYLIFFYVSLAAIAVLLELILPSILLIFVVNMLVCMGLLYAYLNYKQVVESAQFLLYIFPLVDAASCTMTHLTSHLSDQLGSGDNLSQRSPNSMLTWIIAFCIIITLLISYLDYQLMTGNGMLLPATFPFRRGFWCPRRAEGRIQERQGSSDVTEPHIEPVIGCPASIVVENIHKTYVAKCCCCCATGPTVLSGLSCTIYKNQITALIGHNGAGKTTIIKILTGADTPDKGVAYINGVKVTDPLDRLALRGCISICPQFDSLCGALTVIESIQITLHCKGFSDKSQVEKARAMLQRLGLGDKENVRSTDLSGGQKRKLNTILALLGDPEVVFLDEPTSGLDPVSRRQLWQLLQEEKIGRSIVLCTQFMDEADVLADRKIFLCGGQIVCAGSSMFLKRAFGCSFTLNVSLKSKSDAANLLSDLRQTAQLKSQFDTELQFEVPAANPKALLQAVQVLESSQGIAAFGVSPANLDDIFMKLSGANSSEIIDAFRSGELAKYLSKYNVGLANKNSAELALTMSDSKQVRASVFRQFSALLFVNLKRQLRTRGSVVSRFVIPALLLGCLALTAIKYPEKVNKADNAADGFHKSNASAVRYLQTAKYQRIKFICVYHSRDAHVCNESCWNLALINDMNNPPVLLSMPDSETLPSFLAKDDTAENLYESCQCDNDDCLICVIYHASSWNKSESNHQRVIAIGMFSFMTLSENIIAPYEDAFARISYLFDGSQSIATNVKMTHIKPFSQHVGQRETSIPFFIILFCIFPASYLSDPIEDMSSRVRAYLKSMGMSHIAYWINIFLLHWIQYAVCFALSAAILCIWGKASLGYFTSICILVLFLGTTSNQLTVYSVAAVTKGPNNVVFVSFTFLCFALPHVLMMLEKFNKAAILQSVFLLPPMAPISLLYFSLTFAAYNLDYFQTDRVSDIPDLFVNCWYNEYILFPLIAMPIHIVILCCIIALAENSDCLCTSNCCRKKNLDGVQKLTQPMDRGAMKEADRVMQSLRDTKNVLEVRQLCKTYPNGVRAVRGVTFATMAGEIFGLLGANGAGKSTSMSVIVGDEPATSGECEVLDRDGTWVSARRGASTGAIGFCPQHNPLFGSVTVVEHVALYAAIRGVPSADVDGQTAALLRSLGLEQHRDKQVSQLSGGNKRRLCLAIALLGDPALVVIDEASTGVDPENKRFIWTAIRGMLSKRRSVIVTTHSMEEVEALCSRVAIMNVGRVIAFGTVQQLRSGYGDAYMLDVLLKQSIGSESAVEKTKATIKEAVASRFEGATVLDDLSQCVQFCIPKASVGKFSSALKWLADNQTRLGMEFYSFYQMSLDQVFVKLVKQFDGSSGAD